MPFAVEDGLKNAAKNATRLVLQTIHQSVTYDQPIDVCCGGSGRPGKVRVVATEPAVGHNQPAAVGWKENSGAPQC